MVQEGGNTFEDVQPIRGDLAKLAAGDIINQLKLRFGEDIQAIPQGSCARKGPDEYCGDIDILLQINSGKEADYGFEMAALEQFIKKTWSDSVATTQQGALKNIISFEYPYDENGEEKLVQVDIKLTHNFDWTSRMGYSEKNTMFKDALRKILLKVCASVAPYQGEDPDSHQNEFFTVDDFRGKNGEDGAWAGEPKGEWRYSMDDSEGLYYGHRTRDGKKSPGFRSFSKYNTQLPRWGAYDKKEFVTDKFDSALNIIFGPEVTQEDVSSVENIIKFLHSGKYKYASAETLKKIKEHVEFELERSNRGLGDDIVDRFDEIWDKYSNGMSSSPLMECNNVSLGFRDLMRRMNSL